MREHLIRPLLDRALVQACPNEDYFLAGPRPAAMRQFDTARHEALIADIRSRRRARHSVAA